MTLDVIHSREPAPTGSGLEGQWRRHLLQLSELTIQRYDNGGDDAELEATIEQVRREMSAVEDALDRLARTGSGSARAEPVSR
jgi:hypothetical protein